MSSAAEPQAEVALRAEIRKPEASGPHRPQRAWAAFRHAFLAHYQHLGSGVASTAFWALQVDSTVLPLEVAAEQTPHQVHWVLPANPAVPIPK